MFLDASAIVAILARDPDRQEILDRLDRHRDGGFFVSPLVRYEAVQALARQKTAKSGSRDEMKKPSREDIERAEKVFDTFIRGLQVEETAISPAMGTIALEASARYGKAVGHPADLNFGDCFAYACARVLGVPLAYKGNDFSLTDLA